MFYIQIDPVTAFAESTICWLAEIIDAEFAKAVADPSAEGWHRLLAEVDGISGEQARLLLEAARVGERPQDRG